MLKRLTIHASLWAYRIAPRATLLLGAAVYRVAPARHRPGVQKLTDMLKSDGELPPWTRSLSAMVGRSGRVKAASSQRSARRKRLRRMTARMLAALHEEMHAVPLEERDCRDGALEGVETAVVREARQLQVSRVEVFGAETIGHSPERRLPQATVSIIKDAIVHSPSMAVIRGTSIVRFSPESSLLKFTENYSRYFDSIGDRFVVDRNPDVKYERHFKDAYLLGNRFAKNYFHWVTECMPKLLMTPLEASQTLLIPNVPWQQREMAELFGRTTIIGDLEAVRIDRLTVPVYPSFSPDTAEEAPLACYDDTLLIPLRDAIVERLGSSLHGGYGDVIYLRRRGNDYRHLLNEDEILASLERLGARVFDPAEHSLADQVSAFRNAGLIVAPAGAGLANIIFCRPGTKVIVMSRGRLANPGYFNIAAKAAGVSLRSVAGYVHPDLDDVIHASYGIHIDDLGKALG